MSFRPEHVDCRGTPRELGRSQGRKQAEALRAALGPASTFARHFPSLFENDSCCLGLKRHVPQQYERLCGIAGESGVSRARLFRRDALELESFVWGVSGNSLGFSPPSRGWLRRSRPDAGFESLEWLAEGRVTPTVGCNREGLSGLCCITAFPGEPTRAPTHWLLSEALLRFRFARPAAEWCARRSSVGQGCLVFVDATAEKAGVQVDGGVSTLVEVADRSGASASQIVRTSPTGLALETGDGVLRYGF